MKTKTKGFFMRKFLVIVLVVMLIGLLMGCAPPIVKDGPLVKEDFFFYKDGKVVGNPDNEAEGLVYLSSNQTSARNIRIGDSLEKVQKAYGVLALDNYNDINLEGCGRRLTLSFDEEDKLQYMRSYNADGLLQKELRIQEEALEAFKGDEIAEKIIYDKILQAQADYERRMREAENS